MQNVDISRQDEKKERRLSKIFEDACIFETSKEKKYGDEVLLWRLGLMPTRGRGD